MDFFYLKKPTFWLQIIAWIMAIVLFYLYLGQRLGRSEPTYLMGITGVSFLSYMAIIYGYVLFIYPTFYRNQSITKFLVVLFLFFIGILSVRIVIEIWMVGPLTHKYQTIFTFSLTHILYALTSSFIALIIGILLNAYIQNYRIQKRLEIQQKMQTETELQHLKSQLSPHFIFNTLNSIYYDTYKILPEVATRIVQMSELVRYYLDSESLEKVDLSTEINHLKNYIELEKIRIHDPEKIKVFINVDHSCKIPPMVLLPFAENIFKHGIDQFGNIGYAEISISTSENQLYYKTINVLHQDNKNNNSFSGRGLNNLRNRLTILYKNQFTIEINKSDHTFTSTLKIPLYENQ